MQPWRGSHQRGFDETNTTEQQLWICRWAASGERQQSAHPVGSYFHTGCHFDSVFLGDSQRETERKKEGARLFKLSDVKCDLRTEKTLRALFKTSSFPNAARQLLLTLSKFQSCRRCCFCHLKIVKQDLAIFSTRRPFKNAFHRFRREPRSQYLVTTANPFTQPVAIFKHLAPFDT